MPLNRLRSKEQKLQKSSDYIPIVERLTYDVTFKKAIHQVCFQGFRAVFLNPLSFVALKVFGKTIVARDMDLATQLARTHNLDTITLAGSTWLFVSKP